MKTQKEHVNNLNNGIITSEMLQSALYSVNKRAKNYRDNEGGCREQYRYSYRYDKYNNEGKNREKKEEMYSYKESLLKLLSPICIHKEFAGYERVRVYDYEKNYDKLFFQHFMRGDIVWQNCFYSYEANDTVEFFDYEDANEPKYRYYLYYVCGDKTFHTPMKSADEYDLPVEEIGKLETEGYEICDLMSLQFVNKIMEVIKSKRYVYKKTLWDDPPLYENHAVGQCDYNAPEWFEIVRFIRKTFEEMAKYLVITGDIENIKLDLEKDLCVKQRVKKVKSGIVLKKPYVKFLAQKSITVPDMNEELASYVDNNFKDDMSEKDFVNMLLDKTSPIYEDICEKVLKHRTLEKQRAELQIIADSLYENDKENVITMQQIIKQLADWR